MGRSRDVSVVYVESGPDTESSNLSIKFAETSLKQMTD